MDIYQIDEFGIFCIGFGQREDVFDVAGLLVNDGQWVVDFMSYSGSQTSQGDHLVGVLHLMQRVDPLLVGQVDLIDQMRSDPERNQQDHNDACRQNSRKCPGRFIPRLNAFALLLDHY